MKIQLKTNVTLVDFIMFKCTNSFKKSDIVNEDYGRQIPIYLKYCYNWIECKPLNDLDDCKLFTVYDRDGYYELLATRSELQLMFNVK